VQWGAWQVAGGGMADAAVLQRAARMGIGAVSAPAGLAALARLLQAGAGSDRPPVAAVSPFHWPAFLALLPRPRPPFFDAVATAATAAADVAASATPSSSSASAGRSVAAASTDAVRALAALSSADARREAVQASILRIVRDVAAVEVGPADPLMESGIDSLGGVELKNKIEAMYGVELPATAAFDYPSVEALAGFLSEQIDPSLGGGESGAEEAAGPAWAAVPVPSAGAFIGAGGGRGPPPSAVAMLGWAGSAPAAAAAVGSLGAAPAAADGLRAMPWDRWDHDAAGGLDPMEAVTAVAAASAKFGAWVPGVARFDGALFGISAGEACIMDPQQRHLLEAVHTLSLTCAAGLLAAPPGSGVVAVAVGIMTPDYSRIIPATRGTPPSPYLGTGNAVSVACGRLSYNFALKGTSIAVDTACSSSLVAAHIARGLITVRRRRLTPG
jgi:acyl carrier protein